MEEDFEETFESVETNWYPVKQFMRYIFDYNDLNSFLEKADNLANLARAESPTFAGGVFDLSVGDFSFSPIEERPWSTDDFYPILPESNKLFIKVRVDEGGIDLNAKSVWMLKEDLGLEAIDAGGYPVVDRYVPPRWFYWSRLELWNPHQAACLLFEMEPEGGQDISRSSPWNAIKDLERIIETASEIDRIKGHYKVDAMAGVKDITLVPKSFIQWAKNQGFAIPTDMKIPVVEDTIIEKGPKELSAKESRELGTLRNEKEKWDKSIEAAVYATHLLEGEKITRGKLWEALAKFDLPETTHEIVWKAMRKKGLTKKAGRPKKTE